MMATTGVALNLKDQVFKPVVSVFGALTPGVFEKPRSDAVRPRHLSYAEALSVGARAAAERDARLIPAYVFHVEEPGLYGVAVAEPGANPRDGLGPSWIYIDHNDGTILATEIMGEGTNGDVVLQAQFPLHSGRLAGFPGRVAIALTGISTTALSVTGIVIWQRKRFARRRTLPHDLR